MTRVKIAQSWFGLCAMQVCAEADATDKEILDVCNSCNPSGTTRGWTRVLREKSKHKSQRPVSCDDFPGRVHFIVTC